MQIPTLMGLPERVTLAVVLTAALVSSACTPGGSDDGTSSVANQGSASGVASKVNPDARAYSHTDFLDGLDAAGPFPFGPIDFAPTPQCVAGGFAYTSGFEFDVFRWAAGSRLYRINATQNEIQLTQGFVDAETLQFAFYGQTGDHREAYWGQLVPGDETNPAIVYGFNLFIPEVPEGDAETARVLHDAFMWELEKAQAALETTSASDKTPLPDWTRSNWESMVGRVRFNIPVRDSLEQQVVVTGMIPEPIPDIPPAADVWLNDTTPFDPFEPAWGELLERNSCLYRIYGTFELPVTPAP
ncbi:MAG: hypothetical protein R3C39_08950 [Dehalococcoidia bacterium]